MKKPRARAPEAAREAPEKILFSAWLKARVTKFKEEIRKEKGETISKRTLSAENVVLSEIEALLGEFEVTLTGDQLLCLRTYIMLCYRVNSVDEPGGSNGTRFEINFSMILQVVNYLQHLALLQQQNSGTSISADVRNQLGGALPYGLAGVHIAG